MKSRVGLRVAGCGIRVAGFGLRVAGCGFRAACYGLRVTGCGMLKQRASRMGQRDWLTKLKS